MISADAFQIYRGLNIGTAKIPLEERKGIPHHLVDILEPHKAFSAGAFKALAEKAYAEILQRGRLPILVGGTGFYVRAFLKNLAAIPPIPRKYRDVLQNLGDTLGWEILYQWLCFLDPAYGHRIASKDRQRIERALEVVFFTGKAFSHFHSGEDQQPDRFPTLKIGLTLPRQLLRERIIKRVESMLAQGWMEEVAQLKASGVPKDAPAMHAIGYRELWDCLEGKRTLEEAKKAIIRRTFHYARRQLTWFRKERGVRWYDVSKPLVLEAIFGYIDKEMKKGEKNE